MITIFYSCRLHMYISCHSDSSICWLLSLVSTINQSHGFYQICSIATSSRSLADDGSQSEPWGGSREGAGSAGADRWKGELFLVGGSEGTSRKGRVVPPVGGMLIIQRFRKYFALNYTDPISKCINAKYLSLVVQLFSRCANLLERLKKFQLLKWRNVA